MAPWIEMSGQLTCAFRTRCPGSLGQSRSLLNFVTGRPLESPVGLRYRRDPKTPQRGNKSAKVPAVIAEMEAEGVSKDAAPPRDPCLWTPPAAFTSLISFGQSPCCTLSLRTTQACMSSFPIFPSSRTKTAQPLSRVVSFSARQRSMSPHRLRRLVHLWPRSKSPSIPLGAALDVFIAPVYGKPEQWVTAATATAETLPNEPYAISTTSTNPIRSPTTPCVDMLLNREMKQQDTLIVCTERHKL